MRRILHEDLGMLSYKIQLVQELKPIDHPIRFRFFADFVKKITFSDKVRFDLFGYVNKQNCRIWGPEISHTYIEKPMHSKRVIVWCAFWSRDIIRPFFFENEQGVDDTVKGDRYRAMLNEYSILDIGNIWVQQDSATCHTATQSMFYALFLKIILLATKLISFGHLEAAI